MSAPAIMPSTDLVAIATNNQATEQLIDACYLQENTAFSAGGNYSIIDTKPSSKRAKVDRIS